MNVIIAEKPSVAREIAAIVGATVKRDGYIEGGGYAVTWALGHLVGLAMPEAYGFTAFRRENLPILPDGFILTPRQIRDGKEWKPDPGVAKQLKVIGELFAKADGIIVATDAGREGELIFRLIYSFLNCRTPFRRMWISSLTDRAIREGMQHLRPGSEYDNLYLSAKARSQADWVVGINASQALAITAGSGTWSLGRVQTPTLAMICARYEDNRDFKEQTYYRLKVNTAKETTTFAVLSVEKYDARAAADDAAERVRRAGTLRVTGMERKEVRQEPPLLYDLTALQKDANSRHGFSAEKTLSIAQALYEAKKISYPRTGSRYISADVMEQVPYLIDTLRVHQRFGAYIESRDGTLNTRPVNEAKVTDHHALLVTGEPVRGLSDEQQLIYDMVAGRMLEAFGRPCVKANTAVTFDADGIAFTAHESVTLVPGWRDVFGAAANDDTDADENAATLPALAEGDVLTICDAEVQERKTKPRPLHTEATLLAAMESAGKECANEEEREAMKDAGIGTPATRAAIIETLFARDYIARDKKSLVPTEKGMTVYMAVRDKKIADVAMTGQWESALSKIGMGEMDAADFHRSIEVYAAQITSELLDMPFKRRDDRPASPCPKCKTGMVTLFPKVAKCRNAECGFMLFRTVAGKELTDAQLTALLTNGKTGVIKGFTNNKTGKPFEAAVMLNANGKTCFDFEKRGAKKGRSK